MKMNEYQELAKRTAPPPKNRLLNYCMGLAGEVGELVDYIKKCEFQGHDLRIEKAGSELGDILWYVANLADELTLNLAAVAHNNIDKLRERYPHGFSEENSRNRTE